MDTILCNFILLQENNPLVQSPRKIEKVFDSSIVLMQFRFNHKMSSTLIGRGIESSFQWNCEESLIVCLVEI